MDDKRKLNREERLALALRENLKRRKAQVRKKAREPGALPKEEGDS